MNGVLIPWVIAATLLLFLAAYWIYSLEKRLAALREDYDALMHLAEETDEAQMIHFLQRLEAGELRLGELEATAQRFGQILPHTVQGLGIVRYNAFEGMGGDQSFSVALVDAAGNGAVISGLHGGADVRVYAKPLLQWRCSYSLSADEQNALAKARQIVSGGSTVAEEVGAGG